MERIRFSVYESPVGTLHVVSTQTGVCRILLPRESLTDLLPWLNRHFRAYELLPDPELNQPAVEELDQYFGGVHRAFEVLSAKPAPINSWQKRPVMRKPAARWA